MAVVADLVVGLGGVSLSHSQSSLLLLQQLHPKPGSYRQQLQLFNKSRFGGNHRRPLLLHFKGGLTVAAAVVSSDSKAPTILSNTYDSANIQVDDTGNGGGDDRSGGGGGGGDNNNNNNNSGGGDSGNKGEGEFSDGGGSKKKMGLSMSQKLTLGYAALVGGK